VSRSRESIANLFFDWDGTLFDSEKAGLIAFQKTFDDLGIVFTTEFYESRYSPNWYSMYEALSLPKDQWKTADDIWLQHYGEQPPKLVHGAAETINELHRKGYRLGIVTSGTHRRVQRELVQLGLTTVFEAVICNEHITNKKPHPEGLTKAMKMLDATPKSSIYVGDAPEDVRMGKSAKVYTVGVRSAYPTSRNLADENPDLFLDRISELVLHF